MLTTLNQVQCLCEVNLGKSSSVRKAAEGYTKQVNATADLPTLLVSPVKLLKLLCMQDRENMAWEQTN